MPLRIRLILFLALIALLPLILFGYTAYRASTTSLIDVERDNLNKALDNAQRAIDNLQNTMNSTARDWSNYTDLHDQYDNFTSDWATTNLDPSTPTAFGATFHLGVIGMWGSGLMPLYTYGPAQDAATRLDPVMRRAILRDTPQTMLAVVGSDVYIVAITSVRTNEALFPNGIFMFGRKLGQDDVNQIRDLTGDEMALYHGNTLIAATDGAKNLTPDPAAFDAAATGQAYFQQSGTDIAYAAKPIQDNQGHNVATMIVLRPRTATLAAQNSITTTLVIWFILGALLAGIGGLVLSRTIVEPLLVIVGAANKFAEGNLSERVALKGGDELGQLATSFNQMADKISERVTASETEASRLQEIDAYRLNLLAEITQALRPPLDTIRGHADTLDSQQYGNLNEPQKRLVSAVRRSISMEEALLADLLDFSRAQQNQLRIFRERVSVAEIAQEIATAVKERFADKRIQLSLDIPRDLPPVMADKIRLAQIFDSLLSWTFDFTPTNGRIAISSVEEDDFVRVTITDNSSGMTAEEKSKVFDLFYHPNRAGAQTVGLGLAFVKALVEQQGGTITVESEPGRGNLFTLTLPVA